MLGTADHWFPGHIVKDYDEKKMREALRNSPHAEKISNILKESRILFEDTPIPRLSKSWQSLLSHPNLPNMKTPELLKLAAIVLSAASVNQAATLSEPIDTDYQENLKDLFIHFH